MMRMVAMRAGLLLLLTVLLLLLLLKGIFPTHNPTPATRATTTSLALTYLKST